MQIPAFADGQLLRLCCEPDRLVVDFIDWQAARWQLIFTDVIASCCFGAAGSEIAELREQASSVLLQTAQQLAPDFTGCSYQFIDAWTQEVVLEVIAGSLQAISMP